VASRLASHVIVNLAEFHVRGRFKGGKILGFPAGSVALPPLSAAVLAPPQFK
jgi:hypothetical protein